MTSMFVHNVDFLNLPSDESYNPVFYKINGYYYFFVVSLADEFKTLFHSLDVWHKAKSIRKSIQKVVRQNKEFALF